MIMLEQDILIDTDVLIDYLREQSQAVTYLEELKILPNVSVVTVAGCMLVLKGLADALIAATAKHELCTLVTLNH